MNVAVAADHRRRGIATTLLERLFEVTAADPRRGYTLEVRVSNSDAIRLYERLGFEARGIRRGYYTDNREDALIMWREPGRRPSRRRDPRDRDVVRRDGGGGRRRTTASVLSSVVSSQADLHARYGGVVPEIASRRHLELVAPVVREALDAAGASLDDVERVAVTQGPGLVGALLVGLSAAKALAWARRLPLAPVDHLEGHVASLYLEPEPLEPPFLCLLASGGHTLLLAVRERGRSERLGTTLDDAAGEAFDKGARLLGLGYPGGAAIDRLARDGDPTAFAFPVARVPGLDFSFSGLKTALLYTVRDLGDGGDRATAGRSRRVVPARDRPGARADGSTRPCRQTGLDRVAVVGGVAANSELRAALPDARFAPLELCTDNAAMIASAARYVEALPYPRYLGLDAYASFS